MGAIAMVNHMLVQLVQAHTVRLAGLISTALFGAIAMKQLA